MQSIIGGTAKDTLHARSTRWADKWACGGRYVYPDQDAEHEKRPGGSFPCVHSRIKKLYQRYMKETLESTDNLLLVQDEITDILTDDKGVAGVRGAMARAILPGGDPCDGVYLKGKVIVGEYTKSAGPSGLFPADHLSASLSGLGFSLQRFKNEERPRA